MASWDEFMEELDRETEAGGPEAIADREILRLHYSFSTQVFLARKEQKLTQQALAERCGIDQAEISRIERGDASPTLGTMVRVLSALGLRLAFEVGSIRQGTATRRVSRAAAPRRAKRR